MRYLGGKSRIAKQIIDIMSAEREEGMTWVEPFVGSGKVISQVSGRRIGADLNHEMIALFKAIRGGWIPPKVVTREFWYKVKENQGKYPDHLKAFVGIGCSFGGVKWQSYAQNEKNNGDADYAYNSLMKMKPLLENIEFQVCDYRSLVIPERSLVYCDPPYLGTAGYGFEFKHEEFYDWCRELARQGHYVFVSEYDMPNDFEEIWSKSVQVSVRNYDIQRKKIERLYRVHRRPPFSLKMY